MFLASGASPILGACADAGAANTIAAAPTAKMRRAAAKLCPSIKSLLVLRSARLLFLTQSRLHPLRRERRMPQPHTGEGSDRVTDRRRDERRRHLPDAGRR